MTTQQTSTTETRGEFMAYPQPLYQTIASIVDARLRCLREGNSWSEKHLETLEQIERDVLPSGSGIDSGTRIDLDASTGEKLVLHVAYHHMDEHGGYDGWTEHVLTITPSLIHGFSIRIGGPNRNDIKAYLSDVFHAVLSEVR